jgi:hypothetical protein
LDLSNLTMSDYTRLKPVIFSDSPDGKKRGRIRSYIRQVNAGA